MAAADQPSTDAMLKQLAQRRANRGKPGYYPDGTPKPPANDGRTPGYFQSSTPRVNTPYSTTPAAKKRYGAQGKKDMKNVPLWNASPRTKLS